MIRIVFFFTVRDVAGRNEINDIFASNLGELLEKLIQQYPKLEKVIFADEAKRKLRPEIMIMLNGIAVRKLDAPVNDGDLILIMTMISGG